MKILYIIVPALQIHSNVLETKLRAPLHMQIRDYGEDSTKISVLAHIFVISEQRCAIVHIGNYKSVRSS